MKKPIKPKRNLSFDDYLDVAHRVEDIIEWLSKYPSHFEVAISPAFEINVYGDIELTDQELEEKQEQYEKDLRKYNQYRLDRKRKELKKLEEELG